MLLDLIDQPKKFKQKGPRGAFNLNIKDTKPQQGPSSPTEISPTEISPSPTGFFPTLDTF
jgi:hypothetical protein